MKDIFKIILKILKLDNDFYNNVSDEAEDLTLAALVVIISSLAAGIGSISQVGIAGIIVGTIGSLINWGLWAGIIYIVLIRFFPENTVDASPREIFIVLGFASAPGVIKAGGIIPPFHSFLFILSNLWMGVSMVKALEVKTEFKNRWIVPALVVGGWLAMAVIIVLAGLSMKRLY
ncbi:MAG: hypothetical protein PF545_07500 [Elusimicrobia bacterium]|jgi:hypothetical protein|nr:hypothetical protein [Elusimicrobiota bacterium]